MEKLDSVSPISSSPHLGPGGPALGVCSPQTSHFHPVIRGAESLVTGNGWTGALGRSRTEVPLGLFPE